MRHLAAALLLLPLVACGGGSRYRVLKWTGSTTGEDVIFTLDNKGEGAYSTLVDGAPDDPERVVLNEDQVNEIGDLFRSKNACTFKHDPSYAPPPGEPQTTVELSFKDLNCTVTLYNGEWQRGDKRELFETMRSMKPLRQRGPKKNREINPRSQQSRHSL